MEDIIILSIILISICVIHIINIWDILTTITTIITTTTISLPTALVDETPEQLIPKGKVGEVLILKESEI